MPAPNLIRAGLADVVELRLGSALDTLPQLAAEGRGPFDLIFVDAEKRDNPAYYEWSMKLARRGSVIVFDNVVRDGAVIDPNSPNPSVQGIRRFNDIVAADPRVTATGHPNGGQQGLRRLCDSHWSRPIRERPEPHSVPIAEIQIPFAP